MMDQLADACAHKMLRLFEGLFEQEQDSSTIAEVPIIGGEFSQSSRPSLALRVCAALLAREWFKKNGPAWAPMLPLREDECERLADGEDNRLKLVGYFGSSLRESDWDWASHPSFDAYSRGLLCYEFAPRALLNDLALQGEFLPRPLPGLCDGWLVWRDRNKIAVHRKFGVEPHHTNLQFGVIETG